MVVTTCNGGFILSHFHEYSQLSHIVVASLSSVHRNIHTVNLGLKVEARRKIDKLFTFVLLAMRDRGL